MLAFGAGNLQMRAHGFGPFSHNVQPQMGGGNRNLIKAPPVIFDNKARPAVGAADGHRNVLGLCMSPRVRQGFTHNMISLRLCHTRQGYR